MLSSLFWEWWLQLYWCFASIAKGQVYLTVSMTSFGMKWFKATYILWTKNQASSNQQTYNPIRYRLANLSSKILLKTIAFTQWSNFNQTQFTKTPYLPIQYIQFNRARNLRPETSFIAIQCDSHSMILVSSIILIYL